MVCEFVNSFQYKLIYVFSINDESHKGILKIGETTVDSDCSIDQLQPNCKILNDAAKKRINEYTVTAGIQYQLLHTELAIKNVKQKDGTITLRGFRDYDVHNVLINSRIKRKKFLNEMSGKEWFYVDLDTAKKAIKAVKDSQINLGKNISENSIPTIVFRPEQEAAIKQTIDYFKKKGNAGRMLWNAKMRFGKTLTTLKVIKEMHYKRCIIITHRPVVSDSWEDDFYKIFSDDSEMKFASKKTGYVTDSDFTKLGNKFIYFASIHDLRGSSLVGGKFKKNGSLFDLQWDLLVVDEAHEGTQTVLGTDVIKALLTGLNNEKQGTKLLALSGTAFNILDKYEDNAVYTWDYIQEQEAKEKWNLNHFGDSNPYSDLPKMHIYTYDLGKLVNNPQYYPVLSEKAFSFSEFFRVNAEGQITEGNVVSANSAVEFVHKDDVQSFLNLLTKDDPDSHYPFSNDKYRALFRHSLWMVPGVKEAKALKQLMQKHPIFGSSSFKIINVAGSGDEDITESELATVKNAIYKSGQKDYTITISCGRLTAGVTVPEWTAVLMLSGSYSTSASNYLQTIFRVQSPCNSLGKIKTDCFVFDFAPDRTLKMVANAVSVSPKAGKGTKKDNAVIGEFLNYCPVISFDGTQMVGYKTDTLLQQLKKAYADRAVRTGFDDNSIYSYDELFGLDDNDVKEFENLKGIIGTSAAQEKSKDITVNDQGFSDEEREKLEDINKKNKKDLTPAEKATLEKLKELKKNRKNAISILRGISIRMPLLIYGADIDLNADFKIEDFLDDKIVDPQSWGEFMPKGVTKTIFKNFIKYYDKDVFIAASRKIRELAKEADLLDPTERVKKIAELFSCFRNPDKETVLTPWRVVNMHMGMVLGGYNFFDEAYNIALKEPRRIVDDNFDGILSKSETKILEINSKTGLYPLYIAYSIYRKKLYEHPELKTLEEKNSLWAEVLINNIYVICKTPMAKSITRRTLAGYNEFKLNAHYFKNLISDIKKESSKFIKRVLKPGTWNYEERDIMKFDAVVGNPPYQESIDKTSDIPVYNYFMDAAFSLSKKVSFITPARFLFNAGKTPKEWNNKILQDEHFKVVFYTPKSTDVFTNVDIKGGVAITLRDEDKVFGKIGNFFAFDEIHTILQKTQPGEDNLSAIVYPCTKFNLDALYKANPAYKEIIGSNGNEKRLTTSIFVQLDCFVEEKDENHQIEIKGLINNQRVSRYIFNEYIDQSVNLRKYKVIVPKSNGSGALGEVLSTPMIGLPMTGYTQSFISFGEFDSLQEAECCMKYLKTKFVRCLLGTLKVTQHNPKQTWRNVPMQKFSCNSDIDWSKSIKEIDAQLYDKYGLSHQEICFIEEKICPMS